MIKVNIMDAIIGMEGEGPGNGDPKNTGLIVASTDAYALDIVQSRIMGFDAEEMPYLKAGMKRGYPQDIEIIGDFNKVPVIPYHPIGSQKGMQRIVSTAKSYIFKSVLIPDVDESKCIKCEICAKNCPVQCITMGPYPKFDRKVCIECYCCHEHCPQGAIFLRRE